MKISNLLKSGLASLALAGALLAGCSNSNGPKPGSYTGVFMLTQTITAMGASAKIPEPDFAAAGLIQATVSDNGTVSGAITIFDSSVEDTAIVDMPNPALFGHTYLFSGDADSSGFSIVPDLINIYDWNYAITGDATINEDGSISGTLSGTITNPYSDTPSAQIGTVSGAVGGIPNGDTKYMSVACGGFGFGEDGVGSTDGFAGFIMHDKQVYALLASPEFTGTLNLSYTGDVSGPCSVGVDTGCAEGDGTMVGTADIPADGGDGYKGDVTLDATYGFYQDQANDWQTAFTYFELNGSMGDVNAGFSGGFGGSTESCLDGGIVYDWWND